MLIGVSGLISSGKDTIGECFQALDCWHNEYACNLLEFQDYDDIEFCKSILEGNFEKIYKGISSWEIKKFATKLKQMTAILFDCNAEDFESIEFKNTPLPPEWQIEGEETRTYRHALLDIGTKCIRNNYNNNAWVISALGQYKPGKYSYGRVSYPKWIITDVRFLNEINAIKERGGYMIRVDRGKLSINHPSEIEWQSYEDWDFIVDNSGDYKNLIRQVKSIMMKLDLFRKK